MKVILGMQSQNLTQQLNTNVNCHLYPNQLSEFNHTRSEVHV